MIDGLNNLTSSAKTRSMDYEKYFGEMELSESEKKKRIKMAKEFEGALLFLFALITVYGEYNISDIQAIIFTFKSRYRNVLQDNVEIDEQLDEYISLFSSMVVDTTYKNIDDEYFLSDDRARYIAENEANTVANYEQFKTAVNSGKTKKKWIDMRDNRERKTHLKVGGTVKPINDYFVVGESLMLYPKSLDADPKEVINCRCTIKYF
jgi:hypothetical protein